MPGAEVAMMAIPLITSMLQSGGQASEVSDKSGIAGYNATVAEQSAQMVRQAADFQIARMNRSKNRYISKQRTLYAKAGVRMEGSPIEVMADTATEFELDKLAVNYNAALQISSLQSEAQLSRLQEKQYKKQGKFQPIMTILGGVSKFGMDYAFSQAGKTPVDTGGGRGTPISTSSGMGVRHA